MPEIAKAELATVPPARSGMVDAHSKEIVAGDWIRYEFRGEVIEVRQGRVFYNTEEACWCVSNRQEEGGYERLFTLSRIEIVEPDEPEKI